MVFLFAEKVVEADVAGNEEWDNHEGEAHFEEDVEDSVKADGNDEAFGEFLFLKEGFFAEAEDFVEGDGPMAAVALDFFLKDGFGEVGDAVVITKDTGEEEVGEGGKGGSEKER